MFMIFYQHARANNDPPLPVSPPSFHRRPPPPPPACLFRKARVSAFSQSTARGEYIYNGREKGERKERSMRWCCLGWVVLSHSLSSPRMRVSSSSLSHSHTWDLVSKTSTPAAGWRRKKGQMRSESMRREGWG
jgi:hypothetical protein